MGDGRWAAGDGRWAVARCYAIQQSNGLRFDESIMTREGCAASEESGTQAQHASDEWLCQASTGDSGMVQTHLNDHPMSAIYLHALALGRTRALWSDRRDHRRAEPKLARVGAHRRVFRRNELPVFNIYLRVPPLLVKRRHPDRRRFGVEIKVLPKGQSQQSKLDNCWRGVVGYRLSQGCRCGGPACKQGSFVRSGVRLVLYRSSFVRKCRCSSMVVGV